MKILLSVLMSLNIATLLTGCSIQRMVDSAIQHSKYSPAVATPQQIDKYYADVKSVDRKIVQDKLGTYYHQMDGDNFYKIFLNHEDSDALKNILSTGTGILEPVAIIDKTGKIRIDWAATERRHRFFTEKVKLKLLPLEVTKQLHDLNLKYAKEQGSKVANYSAFSLVTTGYSGEHLTIYNTGYKQGVIQKLSVRPDYFIKDYFSEVYYNRVQNGSDSIPLESELISLYKFSSIDLIPTSYYENLTTTGLGRYSSSCTYITPDAYRYIHNMNKFENNIPYMSGKKLSSEERSRRDDEMEKFIKQFPNMQINQEKACLYGLRQLAVSGVIQSKPLE